jgi:protein gp37
MTENSKIEWTDHTFNPWVGCTKISPGCDHCYAESWAKRAGSPELWADGERRRTTAQNWRQPFKWNAAAEAAGVRARVFCASLADVFDNSVPREWRADLFRVIHNTPHLDWLLLTKRIGNAREMIERARIDGHLLTSGSKHWPWPNVWLGATVVNQEEADRDIPKLLATPARIRFLSCEPLLGPIDFAGWWVDHQNPAMHETTLEALDWVIVGGESGGGARGMDVGWAVDIVEQCKAVETAVFVKQLGARPFMSPGPITWPTTSTKGSDMSEWPEVLRVREFPV